MWRCGDDSTREGGVGLRGGVLLFPAEEEDVAAKSSLLLRKLGVMSSLSGGGALRLYFGEGDASDAAPLDPLPPGIPPACLGGVAGGGFELLEEFPVVLFANHALATLPLKLFTEGPPAFLFRGDVVALASAPQMDAMDLATLPPCISWDGLHALPILAGDSPVVIVVSSDGVRGVVVMNNVRDLEMLIRT